MVSRISGPVGGGSPAAAGGVDADPANAVTPWEVPVVCVRVVRSQLKRMCKLMLQIISASRMVCATPP
ncbi:hypothetical protein ACVWXU_004137 [Streptomyces sp. TE33382]